MRIEEDYAERKLSVGRLMRIDDVEKGKITSREACIIQMLAWRFLLRACFGRRVPEI